MSEEEKKKELLIHTNNIIKNGLENDDDIQLILKKWLCLYNKQQKEIEELNKALMTATLKIEGLKIEAVYNNNYISKDKIKEKIKKYQEKAEDVKQKYKGVYAYKDDYLEALAKIEGYQELLEENNNEY